LIVVLFVPRFRSTTLPASKIALVDFGYVGLEGRIDEKS
jgi:hypothetical protein